MNRVTRTIGAVGLFAGLVAGGYAIASSADRTQDVAPSNTVLDPQIPPKAVPTEAVFSDRVAAAPQSDGQQVTAIDQDGYSVQIYRDGGQLCFSLTLKKDESINYVCGNQSDVASGLAYLVYLPKVGEPATVIGVVPDDVQAVSVEGHSLKISNNAWAYESTSAQVELNVAGDGGRSANTVVQLLPEASDLSG